MSAENEHTTVVAETRTAFEAETIAAALRERGVDARVFDAATTMAWGTALAGVSGVKVAVLEHEADAARRALEEIRTESASIDWNQVDLGSDPAVQRLAQVSRSRRWVWTLIVLLVPAGFLVLTIGVARGDPILKIIGGVVLSAALVMGVVQMMPSAARSRARATDRIAG